MGANSPFRFASDREISEIITLLLSVWPFLTFGDSLYTRPHQLLTSLPFHRERHWRGRAALTSPDFGVHMADIKSRLYVG